MSQHPLEPKPMQQSSEIEKWQMERIEQIQKNWRMHYWIIALMAAILLIAAGVLWGYELQSNTL